MFTITASQLITWVIVGLLSGSVAGVILTHSRRGFGLARNLLLGLGGAFVGGILFNLLNIAIAPGVAVSLDDVISGLVGAIVVVGTMRLINIIQQRRS